MYLVESLFIVGYFLLFSLDYMHLDIIIVSFEASCIALLPFLFLLMLQSQIRSLSNI